MYRPAAGALAATAHLRGGDHGGDGSFRNDVGPAYIIGTVSQGPYAGSDRRRRLRLRVRGRYHGDVLGGDGTGIEPARATSIVLALGLVGGCSGTTVVLDTAAGVTPIYAPGQDASEGLAVPPRGLQPQSPSMARFR